MSFDQCPIIAKHSDLTKIEEVPNISQTVADNLNKRSNRLSFELWKINGHILMEQEPFELLDFNKNLNKTWNEIIESFCLNSDTSMSQF